MAADKDQIKANTDIVELVRGYVHLTKAGRTWKGLCPFHQEKSPSFNVDPSRQSFTCFGCGAGGDAFTFVERAENLDFIGAAEFLARRAGLTFERTGGHGASSSEKDPLYDVNATAVAFYRTIFQNTPVAREYIQRRGLSNETIERFQIGYSPDGWEALVNHLRSRRKDMKAAETAGLIKRREDGTYFDMFRARIMFPIHDDQERIVGFGARTMGDEQPKYLNSPETPLFSKSKLLYGLSFARKAIGAEETSLLMEGYLDVIAAHQAGFSNAVATLGTSLTEEHAKRLARLANRAVLVYDSDKAGFKATLRAAELLEPLGADVRVASLPDGEDPDSLLNKGGRDVFQHAIQNAHGRVDWQLDRLYADIDTTTEAGKTELLKKAIYILAGVPSNTERDRYAERLWRLLPLAHDPMAAKMQVLRDAEDMARKRKAQERKSVTPRDGNSAAPVQRARTPYPTAGRTGGSGQAWQPGKGRQADGNGSGYSKKSNSKPAPIDAPVDTTPIPPQLHTKIERAETVLLKALIEPEWRSWTLKNMTVDDWPSDLSRRVFEMTSQLAPGADTSSEELLLFIDETDNTGFSSRLRSRLEEMQATVEKQSASRSVTSQLSSPTEKGLQDCLLVLRREGERRVQQALKELLQASEPLTEEAEARIQVYSEKLRQLKGSASSTSVK